jgi:hypothetical protein
MTAQRTVIFAFKGEPMCFIHVLLNALDMQNKGMACEVVIEGEATKLLPELEQPSHFLHDLYTQVKTKGLITAACKACSKKMGVLEQIQALSLPLSDEMSGHPSMARFIAQGFHVIVM